MHDQANKAKEEPAARNIESETSDNGAAVEMVHPVRSGLRSPVDPLHRRRDQVSERRRRHRTDRDRGRRNIRVRRRAEASLSTSHSTLPSVRVAAHCPGVAWQVVCTALFVLLLLVPLPGVAQTAAETLPEAGPATTLPAEAHSETGHEIPFAPVLLELAVIIGVAMVGRWLAERYRQSAVLGELLIGVVAGNVGLWLGIPLFVMVMHLGEAMPLFAEVWLTGQSVSDAAKGVFTAEELSAGGTAGQMIGIMTGADGPQRVAMGFALWLFSELGVILLLLMVGLETQIEEMMRVGGRAFCVAVVGVVTPFGAAVIDDVLGLILLAVVVGVASSGNIEALEIGRISLLSCLFLGSVLLFGNRLIRRLLPFVAALERNHIKLLFPLGLAFLMAWVASVIELAPIVGAFAAGLILSEEQFARVAPESTMEHLVAPLERIFAPVFFVLMGMQVNLQSFLDLTTLWLALIFTIVAIAGKLACGLAAGRGVDRWTIGWGMVPRGEVGLIFASVGKGLGVISGPVFSAIVVMVIVTTLVTPIALKSVLNGDRDRGSRTQLRQTSSNPKES